MRKFAALCLVSVLTAILTEGAGAEEMVIKVGDRVRIEGFYAVTVVNPEPLVVDGERRDLFGTSCYVYQGHSVEAAAVSTGDLLLVRYVKKTDLDLHGCQHGSLHLMSRSKFDELKRKQATEHMALAGRKDAIRQLLAAGR